MVARPGCSVVENSLMFFSGTNIQGLMSAPGWLKCWSSDVMSGVAARSLALFSNADWPLTAARTRTIANRCVHGMVKALEKPDSGQGGSMEAAPRVNAAP